MNKQTLVPVAVLLVTAFSASARLVVPAVPEPATYAAGAAMLGILAVVVWRRRR